jgi:hypothetical protein
MNLQREFRFYQYTFAIVSLALFLTGCPINKEVAQRETSCPKGNESCISFKITSEHTATKSEKIRLAWGAASNVDTYRVLVSLSSDCSNPLQSHDTITDQFKVDPIV